MVNKMVGEEYEENEESKQMMNSFLDRLERTTLPIIVYHPGPAEKFWRSLKLMTNHGKPFVLVAVDIDEKFRDPLLHYNEPPYHDDNPKSKQSWDMKRLANPLLGDSRKINRTQMYRKSNIDYEHGIILSKHNAHSEFIDELPHFDIIYLDYPAYSGDDGVDEISYWASHIKDGGLLIVEHSCFRKLLARGLKPGRQTIANGIDIELVTESIAEFSRGDDDKISVFKIHSKVKKEKLPKIDFLANCFLERRLNITAIRENLEKNRIPYEHPSKEKINAHIERFFELNESFDPTFETEDDVLFLLPRWNMSQFKLGATKEKTWADLDAYRAWLKSLIANEQQLRPRIPSSRCGNYPPGVDIEHVIGNMHDFSDWLVERKDLIIAGRNEPDYIRKAVNGPFRTQDDWDGSWHNEQPGMKDPFWRGLFTRRFELLDKSVYLNDVAWSGEDATPNLTRMLIDAAGTKFPHCRTVAFISHGMAKQYELAKSLHGYEGPINRLIIFSIDHDDYDDWD
jgi:hypothetical protein